MALVGTEYGRREVLFAIEVAGIDMDVLPDVGSMVMMLVDSETRSRVKHLVHDFQMSAAWWLFSSTISRFWAAFLGVILV